MPILWAASVAAPTYCTGAGSAQDQHNFLSEAPANAPAISTQEGATLRQGMCQADSQDQWTLSLASGKDIKTGISSTWTLSFLGTLGFSFPKLPQTLQ